MVMQPSASEQEPLNSKSVGFSYTDEAVKRIARLYDDPTFSDVTFVVQYEDRPARHFRGHRNIISCWSDPLHAMLSGDFSEGSSNEVRIWDVDPDAFEVMLKMMYSAQVELTVDNVLAVLDAGARFDVEPLVQYCVQFMQNHTSIEQACMMLEVGVQYGLVKLMDKCIELIVTDDHILESEEFNRLSQPAVVELAKHDSWNMHEDDIYDKMLSWARANATSDESIAEKIVPILDHIRYLHMSVEKLKQLTSSELVPNNLFEALFFKLNHSSSPDDMSQLPPAQRPREGSRLFSWVPTSKVSVSGDFSENAMHTSPNGFTGVRGDRRMQQGIYSWCVQIVETQSSWIFVGIAQADDPNDVAWRSSGRMLYCLDARYFHQGSGQNHPSGDRKIYSGDCIRVRLDCQNHTLSFGVNNEHQHPLFHDLPAVAYVPAVDLRDCGDKVRLISDVQQRCSKRSNQQVDLALPGNSEDVIRSQREQLVQPFARLDSSLPNETITNVSDPNSIDAGTHRSPPEVVFSNRSHHQPSSSSFLTGSGSNYRAGRARASGRPLQPVAESLFTSMSSDIQTVPGQIFSSDVAPNAGLSSFAPISNILEGVLPGSDVPDGATSTSRSTLARPLSGSEVQAALSTANDPVQTVLDRNLSGSEIQAALRNDVGNRRVPMFNDPQPVLPVEGPTHTNTAVRGRASPSFGHLGGLVIGNDVLASGRGLSGDGVQSALTGDVLGSRSRQLPDRPLSGSEVQAALSGPELSTRPWGGGFSGNEVHTALGLSHPHGATGGSTRMSQPRQSQSALGSTSSAWSNASSERGFSDTAP